MSPEFARLIEVAIKKTDERKLGWERTASPDKFQAAIPGSIIQVWHTISPQYEEPDIHIALLELDGTVLEEIIDTDSDVREKFGFITLNNFRNSVRGQALGTTDAIANALNALEKL